MHLFIDESMTGDGSVMVFVALAVYDNASKQRLRAVVHDMTIELEEHLKKHKKASTKDVENIRLRELKAAGKADGLNQYKDLRDRFFKRIVDEADFSVHVLYFDTRVRKQTLPSPREYRKYGLAIQALLRTLRVSRRTRCVNVTLDSRSSAKPVVVGDKTYTWRKRKSGERKTRAAYREEQKALAQRIRHAINCHCAGFRVRHRTWFVHSHLEQCLQVVDVIVNFCQQYAKLNERVPPWKAVKNSHNARWLKGYELIRERIRWSHNPNLKKGRRKKVPGATSLGLRFLEFVNRRIKRNTV